MKNHKNLHQYYIILTEIFLDNSKKILYTCFKMIPKHNNQTNLSNFAAKASLRQSPLNWVSSTLAGVSLFIAFNVYAVEIDATFVNKIIKIESSFNPLAYNKSSGAIGLMQITPIVLKEYNIENPKYQFTLNDLYTRSVNIFIGNWYLNRIKNHYLKGKGTVDDVLICYNFGYGNWKKYKAGKVKLPKETKNYINKFKKEDR